jgi:hypothetical protein
VIPHVPFSEMDLAPNWAGTRRSDNPLTGTS